MRINREKQWQFLEDELRAEVQEFEDKLKTPALYLMEKGEVFTAQFLSFSENGEMRVRFSCRRPVPRRGEYLYCMTLHKELRNHQNWGDRTYGDLIKDKTNHSEIICNWLAPSDDPDFFIAGFIGVDFEFADWIRDVPRTVLVMGPNKPPYDYMAHLQSLTYCTISPAVNSVLDADYTCAEWNPFLLDNQKDLTQFLLSQLSLNDSLILQGPPGTGKTYQISKLCAELCYRGYSVLVTALTNRALMEIAKKTFMQQLLGEGKVYKTKITNDESREVPLLQQDKIVSPKKGCVVLSTFFITSGVSSELAGDCPFDYVIMDEASQALLPMIAAAKRLGNKTLFVGDVKQMPPVVQLKGSRIRGKGYEQLVDGLNTITEMSLYPTFQLTDSRRLSERAVSYTGIFYNNSLRSKSENKDFITYGAYFLNGKGGPTLLMTDMEDGELASESAINLALAVVSFIHNQNKKTEIAVLACMKKTVRELQKALNTNIKKGNLIIDTVARVQGLTTDICIYVIPNGNYLRSLEIRLFNVATSRATNQTIIIADKEIMGYGKMHPEVRSYLQKLIDDFSFYLPYNHSILLEKK